MNSTKFNFYKNAKYVLIGLTVILLAGLIVGLVLGLNLAEALGGSSIVYFTLSVLIMMVISFIYLLLRYDSITAFCFALSLCLNIAIVIALVAIIRVPVADNFISVLLVTSILTYVFNLILFSKIRLYKNEKENRDIVVNKSIKESFNYILLTTLMVAVVLILSLAIFDAYIYLFVRPMLISLATCLFTTIFVSGPIWGYFYRERPKKVKTKDDTIYVETNENKQ